jgi:uncharacterized protein (DUF1697 family)
MSRKQVITTIAELCRKHFSFSKAIFAPTLSEGNEVIARNPFAKAAISAPTTVHAALLEELPYKEDVERIRALAVKAEAFEIVNGVACLHTPHGFGPSKMREKFDQWIGVTHIARNWDTVLTLAELGHAAEVQAFGSINWFSMPGASVFHRSEFGSKNQSFPRPEAGILSTRQDEDFEEDIPTAWNEQRGQLRD